MILIESKVEFLAEALTSYTIFTFNQSRLVFHWQLICFFHITTNFMIAWLSDFVRGGHICFSNISCFSDDGRTKPEPRKGNLPEPQEYKCLVRATLANKKISTVVSWN